MRIWEIFACAPSFQSQRYESEPYTSLFTKSIARKLTYSFRFIKGNLINVLTCALWSDFFNSLTFVFNMQASIKIDIGAVTFFTQLMNVDLILKSVELSF